MAIITGLKTTGDNVDFLLLWLNSMMNSKDVTIVTVEESYLIRRLRATMVGRMLKMNSTNVENIFFVASDTIRLEQLAELHRNKLVALSFLVGEVVRLESYSNPKENFNFFPEWVANHNSSNAQRRRVSESLEKIQNILGSYFNELTQMMNDSNLVNCLAPIS
jgi:hypothetical protein